MKKLKILTSIGLSISLSQAVEIRNNFNSELSDMFAQHISDPIGGKGAVVAPKWVLTTMDSNTVDEVSVLDQKYKIINRKKVHEFWLLQVDRPINQKSVPRWRDTLPLKVGLQIFTNLDDRFALNLTSPALRGIVSPPQVQLNDLSLEEQVYLEDTDRGRGLFIDGPQEKLLCGQVVDKNTIAFLTPAINNEIDHIILNSALVDIPQIANINLNQEDQPWVHMVYINDEDGGNQYTSFCQTLNSLCQAIEKSPSKNITIIAQTTIPELGLDFNKDYFNEREELIKFQLDTMNPRIAARLQNIVVNARGAVRFILNKQGKDWNIKSEKVGPFSKDLSSPGSIQEFLESGKRYEGKKMFCLYAHGRGWRMVSQDKTPLSTVGFAEGFKNSSLDILRLDSCRSQIIEVLYQIARQNPNVNYVVGSQQITALDNAIETYQRLLPVSGKYNEACDYAKLQSQDKVDDTNLNRDYRLPNANNGNGLTYSTINLKQVIELADSISQLARNLLKYAEKDKPKVLNWLAYARQNGLWFDDKDKINAKPNRNDPGTANESDFYYDLFDIIRLIKEKVNQEASDEICDSEGFSIKDSILICCQSIEELKSKVILENHVSATPFLQRASGLSIDFSPAKKFENRDFEDSYGNLDFAMYGGIYWHELLKLK